LANTITFFRIAVSIGEFHRCGYKFGRWYNMIWMEKIIGEHHSDMDTVSAMMS
jgi:hypothetical protein